MFSETDTLEFHQTEKVRYGWYVIRNYHPRIFSKHENKVRMVCYQKLPP